MSLVISLISLAFVSCLVLPRINAQIQGPGEPLFLTPYIKSGQLDEARRLSLVEGISDSVVSYSGFITVDEALGSNLFFWFFPAEVDYDNAPVLHWIEGSTGLTGLYSLFNDNGPFIVDSDGNLSKRLKTWTANTSIIYLDNPVGAGFSFTGELEGYPTNGAEAAPNMYEFLQQFFTLFPELQKNDFFSSGISYGAGIYAPTLSHYIHQQNQGNPSVPINLQGILLAAPYTDPGTQAEWGESFYHFGLIDETYRALFAEKALLIKQYVQQGINWDEVKRLQGELFMGDNSLFLNATGFEYGAFYNILKETNDLESGNFLPFVESNSTRRSIHVGNITFDFLNPTASQQLAVNDSIPIIPFIEDLLSYEVYRIWYYVGQLDMVCHAAGVHQMIKSLNWVGKEEFAVAPRSIWRVDGRIAGYAKTVRNLTHVLMRNGGHDMNSENPDWSFDLINRFTRNVPF